MLQTHTRTGCVVIGSRHLMWGAVLVTTHGAQGGNILDQLFIQ